MKTFAIAAAAALFSTAAFAQMSPTPQTGNLDASTERQIEQQEPTKDGTLPLDLGVTNALQGSGNGGDIKDSPKYDANTKNSENLEGR
jgi:hypothetical protein